MKSYDLSIIGSGPGGYVAALYASRRGLNVCVIESDLVGGTCLNKGCIPTKVMLNSASAFSGLKDYAKLGIDVNGYNLNFPKVSLRKNEVVLRLRTGIETLFRANRITLVKARARLSGANTIELDNGESITSKNIIIATGSRPAALPGLGINENTIYSSDGILDIKELPRTMMIIGGGILGVEFASIFNAFGVKVTVVEMADRLIPSHSKEASKKLEMIFKKRGIDVLISTTVDPALVKKIDAENVLVAVGRKANIEDIGLQNCGLSINNEKISVDIHLCANGGSIYAIGDCIGGPLLAHKAFYDAMIAVDNIMGNASNADYSAIPSCIYTDPEIASVGLTEEQAKEKHPGVKIAKFPYLASGKAYIIGKSDGFIKIIGDANGKLLGAEILGAGACDMISELALALSSGISIEKISRTTHGHPTLSEIIQEASHVFMGTPIHSA
ncbi:MAG: dihydrolipoyl dehydrogenase [Candidatus Omnitrophota bacterium]|jgi:dihydrolipoamide dehydrogenase